MQFKEWYLRVVLLGPPGAGKGTHAGKIACELSVPKVASGDLLRDHQRRDTSLGQLARSYMDRGVLVPDDVTIKMVMSWIGKHQEVDGFLLDGFPRTLPQAKALDSFLGDTRKIGKVLHVNVSTEELVRRLAGRQICSSCQSIYHIVSAPPLVGNLCDKCGGELYQREDDKEGAVMRRLQVYFDETAPLIEYYANSETLADIDGNGEFRDVGRSLMEAIGL